MDKKKKCLICGCVGFAGSGDEMKIRGFKLCISCAKQIDSMFNHDGLNGIKNNWSNEKRFLKRIIKTPAIFYCMLGTLQTNDA